MGINSVHFARQYTRSGTSWHSVVSSGISSPVPSRSVRYAVSSSTNAFSSCSTCGARPVATTLPKIHRSAVSSMPARTGR